MTTKHEPQWVILCQGQLKGPFSQAEVLEKLGCQQLGPQDALWHPSFKGWQKVADFVHNLPTENQLKIHHTLQKQAQKKWARDKQAREEQTRAEQTRGAVTGCVISSRPAEAAGPDAVATRLRRCAMPPLSRVS